MSDYDFDIVLVAALDECRVIGREGGLPWHLPADLRHFKKTTMGHPLVMGRKTYESLGGGLPGRDNIVLTGQTDVDYSDAVVVHSLDEAFDRVDELDTEEAMVIGGESIFRQTLPRADRMVLTLVAGRHDGDTYFPDFDGDEWEIVDADTHPADDENESGMVFLRLRAAAEPPLGVDSDSDSEAGPLNEKLRDQLDKLKTS